MCGILAILRTRSDVGTIRKRALVLSARQRHRGPDWSGICVQSYVHDGKPVVNVLAHERLAIVDPSSGTQPLYNADKTAVLSVNGEIWNHALLRQQCAGHEFYTKSDCEVIVPLYEKYGDQMVGRLDGLFAFVISDQRTNSYLAARDPIGIMSLYIGWGRDGSVWFASEFKALIDDCDRIEEFPPGHYWSSETNEMRRWYLPAWFDEHIPDNSVDLKLLRETLEKSVRKRMMTDVPYGVLLSGGLDSSLISAIVSREIRRTANGHTPAKLNTFSIGLVGSPDLAAAAEVADFIGSKHHEFTFSPQEGLDALRDVIYHIETYDLTTVRASTPMFLLSRKIQALGVKMVLSGEGADEIFGGYLYFHKAPSPVALHGECCAKVKALSKYDCLRANKSTAAWGVEAREPFLDVEFLDVAMSVDPAEKMIDRASGRIEKYILRKAFDVADDRYLPKSVLWRQKEQFSDGVGYNWINSLRAYAEREVTDDQLAMAVYLFPFNTPTTKEGYLYRTIFAEHFPGDWAAKTVPGGPSIACSTATAVEWDKSWAKMADPSGRAIIGVHEAAV